MACVTSVSYSFLVNGSPQGKVLPSRGLRQGDPLSPFLFILCSEVLSGLCVKAKLAGSLPGIKVARRSPSVNHLLFADDTMFFCKANLSNCSALSRILNRYESASGQSINVSKSAVTFSSKIAPGEKVQIMRALKISREGGVGKYLGLPEHFGRKKKDIFTSIVDKIRQRAHSWSSRFLSSAGKQVLLKAVLSAIPSYAMSCFKLPRSLCKRIQSELTRFWWDDKKDHRKMAWISWDKLTIPKNAGGLGFREIESFNDSLLAKLSWKMLNQPKSLISQVLLGKYCQSSSFMECLSPNSASHGWRGILAGREILRKGLGWSVGTGTSIQVWSEPWLSSHIPTAPFGPPTEANSSLTVVDLISPYTND